MKVIFKRNISIILALMMVFTSAMPSFAAPSKGKATNDISGHWAESDLLTMKDNGIMGGYPDGSMKPDRYVTIAETVKIINKAFKIEGAGDVYNIPYTDVKVHEWYSNDIALAVENGYIQPIAPGMQLRPNAPATREQIGAMFAQIMGLPLDTLDPVSGFKDYSKITGGYQYYFAAAVNEGLFGGYPDNTLRPNSTVTRGIIAAVSNRAMTSSSGSDLHPIFVGPGDLLVEKPDEVISNRIVDNLWISPSVGEGNVTLENVTVRGKLVIKGGGPKSVIIKGESDVALVYMEKESGDLRLKVESPAVVGNVNINAGSRNYLTGEMDSVIQNVKGSELNVEGATVKTIQIKGESSNLYVDKKSTINAITVNRKAADAFMSLDGKITSVVVYAPFVKTKALGTINNVFFTSTAKASEYSAEKGSKTTSVKTDADRVSIRGAGAVDNAIINGNDCIVDTVPTKLDVDKNASGTVSNGTVIPGGSTGNTTPGGNLDNGGNPVNPNLKVTSMEITKYPSAEKLVYKVGDTLDLTGLEVTMQYDNGSTKKLGLSELNANSISINPNPDGNTKVLASTKAVKITHAPSKKTATLTIAVNPIPKVKEAMISASPKTDYINGELLDLTNMAILLRFDDETTKTITYAKTTNSEGKPSDTFKDAGIETSIPNATQLVLKSPGDKLEEKSITVSFRNSNNTLIKTTDPLFVKINPVPRISGLSANGYKFSYVYGDKFDFENLEVRLISSDPDTSQLVLKYIPDLKDFVIKKDEYISDDQYGILDLYRQTAANGDILREVKITQTVGKIDVTVQDGESVGLGNQSNNKILKIIHNAKDVASASTNINVTIKPPSKAVSATISGIKKEFQEGEKFNGDMMKEIRLEIIRDSIISNKPGESLESDLIKVLFKDDFKPYEYKDESDSSTLKTYNVDGKKLELWVYRKNGTPSGELIPGYIWKKDDASIILKHTEPIVVLGENGNPSNVPDYTTELAKFNISVISKYGVEIFRIIKDPTLEGDTNPQSKIFFVDDKTLDISELEVEVKLYGDTTSRYLKSTGSNSNAFTVDIKDIPSDLAEYYNKLAVSLELSSGVIKDDLTAIGLTNDYNNSRIKISMDGNVNPIYSKKLVVKNKVDKVAISGTIAPQAGEIPNSTIPSIQMYEYLSGATVIWDGRFDNGKFKAGEAYTAQFTLYSKPEYTFKLIVKDKITVAGSTGIELEGDYNNIDNKISFKVQYAKLNEAVTGFAAAPAAAPAPMSMSLAPVEIPGTTAQVKTADEFYSALDNNNVGTIEVVANIALAKSVVTTKNIVVKDGYTLTYYVDAPVNSRNTGVSEERNRELRQFRITKNATLTVENQATLNKVGTGNITVDNGGKVVAYGTLSTAGKKLIGKQGTALKTYGTSSIVISNTTEGQLMTLNGNADLIQTMTLDTNLAIEKSARLNVKSGKTLKSNTGTSITNRGTVYIEENASISGSGKFAGISPVGKSFGGLIGADSDAVRYGSKATELNYRQNGSNIDMSFTVPYKTNTVYFSGVSVKAGDLKPGTYTLKGVDGIKTVPVVVGVASTKTGLSKVSLGTNGYIIPSTLKSGNYTVSGIIGGMNVTLEINLA